MDLSGKSAKSVLNVRQNKRIDSLISQAQPGRATKGRAIQFEKTGGINEAERDFYSLKPSNVQRRPNGTLTGNLADGRNVNVRVDSQDGRPTLEIQNLKNSRQTKIRYGEK